MNLLNRESKEEQEVQRALVAFADNGVGLIVYHYGKNIASEIEQLGYCPDELGILGKDSPDHGIWIWEGNFRYWKDYEGEWDVDITTIQWREPNACEWHAIVAGISPFDFMRLEGLKTAKSNLNNDLFKKEMVHETWMRKGESLNFGKIENRDELRAKLIAVDRGRVAFQCPKCEGRVDGKHCGECGYFCG